MPALFCVENDDDSDPDENDDDDVTVTCTFFRVAFRGEAGQVMGSENSSDPEDFYLR